MKQFSDLLRMMSYVSQSSDTFECLGNLISTFEHNSNEEFKSKPFKTRVEPLYDSYYGINDCVALENSFIAFRNKSINEISIFNLESNELVAEHISAESIKMISSRFVQVTNHNLNGVYDLKTQKIEIPCEYTNIKYYGDSFVCRESENATYRLYVCDINGQVINNSVFPIYDKNEICCIFKSTDYSLFSIKKHSCYSLILVRAGKTFTLAEHCLITGSGSCEEDLERWYMCSHPYCLDGGLICIQRFKDDEIISLSYNNLNMQVTHNLYQEIDQLMNTRHKVYAKVSGSSNDRISISKCCWGLYRLDSTNSLEMLLHHKYDEIKLREDGLLDVRIDNSWGLATVENGELTSIKYKYPITSVHVVDSRTNLCGVLSKDFTKILIPTKFQEIRYAEQCVLNGQLQVVSTSNNLPSKPIAVGMYFPTDYLYDGEFEMAPFYTQYAVIDDHYKKVSDFIYDDILYYEPKKIIVALSKDDEDNRKLDLYSLDGVLNPSNLSKEEREEFEKWCSM